MKKQALVLLTAVALLAPPAFAASSDTVYDVSQPASYRDPDDKLVVQHTGMVGYMERVRTTVIRTVTENAHSNTDFLADRPNPGTVKTTVRVKEEVTYR